MFSYLLTLMTARFSCRMSDPVLSVTQLEDRVVPVVGQYAALDGNGNWIQGEILGVETVMPNTGYNGVVATIHPNSAGQSLLATGSLYKTGSGQGHSHHVLTAAHTINNAAVATVYYQLFRTSAGGGISQVTIPIEVPAGSQFQVRHPQADPFGANAINSPGNDIGVLRLVDQVVKSPTRLLVAPRGTDAYTLYAGAATALQAEVVTLAGYGLGGDGERGPAPAPAFGLPPGVKRAGRNRIDLVDVDNKVIGFDFDVGDKYAPGVQNPYDSIGNVTGQPDYGLAGIAANTIVPGPGQVPGPNAPLGFVGSVDVSGATGDSGGPWFLANKQIAGVQSSATSSTWGAYNAGSRVSAQIDDFLRPVTDLGRYYNGATAVTPANIAYDVVLDMNYQVYGRRPDSLIGPELPDDIIITVSNVNGLLQINVSGPDGNLNGVYYHAPAANIKSLTIRGSDDNETIVIDGPLGLAGSKDLTIDGRGGKDIVKIIGLDRPGDYYGTVKIEGGAANEQNELFIDDTSSGTNNTYDVTGSYVTRRGLTQMDYQNFSKLDLRAGTGESLVNVASFPQTIKLGVAAGPTTKDWVKVLGTYLDDPLFTGFEHLELAGGTLKLDTHAMTLDTVKITGGVLDGKANVTATKSLTWSGGAMQGAGRTVSAATSTLTISGGVTLTGRTLENAGTGTWADGIGGGTGTLLNSGTLSARGSLDGLLDNAGVLTPATVGTVGVVEAKKKFRHAAGASLNFDLGAAGPGSDLIAAGLVELGGIFNPQAVAGFPAASYTVVSNTGNAAVVGTFAGLAEGAVVTVGTERYKISYVGGTGHDVVLTRVLKVSGLVWEDMYLDGVRVEEPALAGVSVQLYAAGGTAVLATAASDAAGHYQFPDVPAGHYFLRFVRPSLDWNYTRRDAGDDAFDSDVYRGRATPDGIWEYPGQTPDFELAG